MATRNKNIWKTKNRKKKNVKVRKTTKEGHKKKKRKNTSNIGNKIKICNEIELKKKMKNN